MDSWCNLRRLRAARTSLASAAPPDEPGVYAVYLERAHPAFVEWDLALPIYIGRSGNLARRALYHHLAPGHSGSSTLRRSLGALLKSELGLACLPRGTGASEQDCTHFRFDDAGEQILTCWMHGHLTFSFCPAPDPGLVEGKLVEVLQPPLNIQGCSGRWVHDLKALREACANEARASRGGHA